MTRTSKADLGAQAEDAFLRAVGSLGHRASRALGGAGGDVTVHLDGVEVDVSLAVASVVTPEVVARLLAAAARTQSSTTGVVVGDLVTGAAQRELRDAGWGWLDRRGHLVLRAPGVHIDADVAPDPRLTAEPRATISGVAATSWAVALLLSPDDPPSMREVARRASISHSAISAASKRLVAASLIRSNGRPLVPELFWAVADEWHPAPIALAERPPVGDAATYTALGVNLEDDGPGWAVAGTVGAVAWGAPLAVGSAYPPDFYVPNSATLSQATRRLGQAPRFEERACTVAVAPTPLPCGERFDRESSEWGHWRFAHGLYAALDLAQDKARGVEILADWNPSEFTRVW